MIKSFWPAKSFRYIEMKLEQKRWLMLAAAIIANICIGSGYAWSVFQETLTQQPQPKPLTPLVMNIY